MKARNFRLMAVLAVLLTTMNLQAQVTIGSLNEPTKGAILDLNSDTKGGLLFPNVTIADLGLIPENFTNKPSGEVELTALKGMVVYNAAGSFAIGLYVWTGTQWLNLSDILAIDELGDDIKELIGELSVIASLSPASVVDGIDKVNTKVGNVDIKVDDVAAKVGNKDNLHSTLNKTTIVDGINDVDTKVGNVTALTTSAATRGSTVLAINEVNAKVGTVDTKIGSLNTLGENYIENSSIVGAIVDVKSKIGTLALAKEVVGSPYLSYEAFIAPHSAGHPDSTYATPVFAYVTFPYLTNRPNTGHWTAVNTENTTWRIDYSPNAIAQGQGAWSPTTNMTAAVNATLNDDPGTMTLQPSGPFLVSEWLQKFHDNLTALLIDKFQNSGILAVAAGGTGVDATSISANTVFAAPIGTAGEPAFRPLALTDIPSSTTPDRFLKVGTASSAPAYSPILASDIPVLDASKITTGTLAVANGGTGAATAGQNTVFAGSATAVGTPPAFRKLEASDIPVLDAAKINTGILPLSRGGTGATLGNGTARQVLTSDGNGGAKWTSQDFYKGLINCTDDVTVLLTRADGTTATLTSYADFVKEPAGQYYIFGEKVQVATLFGLPEFGATGSTADGMLILMKYNNTTAWSQLDYLPESGHRFHTKGRSGTVKPEPADWIMDGGVIAGELILVGNAPTPSPYRLRRSGNVVTLSGRCEILAAGVLSGNTNTWQVPANMRPSDTAYGQWYAIGYNGVAGSIESGPFILQAGGTITWRGREGTTNLTIPAVSQGFSFSISYIVDQ